MRFKNLKRIACQSAAFSDSLRAMKIFKVHTMAGATLLAGVLTLTLAPLAFSEDAPPEKAQALLEKVKKGELDRQIAAKQTEIDRLKEDLNKSKKDADSLQK